MNEVLSTFPTTISGIDAEKNVVVLLIAAHRVDSAGRTVPLTSSQASAALANAKSTLETIQGTEVLGSSTSILLPNYTLAEGESLTLKVDAEVVKTSKD